MTASEIATKKAEAQAALAALTAEARTTPEGQRRLTNLRNRLKRLGRAKPMTRDRAQRMFEKAVIRVNGQMFARGYEVMHSRANFNTTVMVQALSTLKLPHAVRQVHSQLNGNTVTLVFAESAACRIFEAVEHAWQITNSHRALNTTFTSVVNTIASAGIAEEFHAAYVLDAPEEALWEILKRAMKIDLPPPAGDTALEAARARVRGIP